MYNPCSKPWAIIPHACSIVNDVLPFYTGEAVTVAVDCAANVADLSVAARAAGVTLGVLIELDVGMGRAGVSSADEALELARTVTRAPGLRFRGLMGFEGHVVDHHDLQHRS